MKTKMAVFDLDKTLLNDAGQLPASFASDLAQLEAMGVQFVAASSRPYRSIQRLFEPYLQRICGACDNGNVVFRGLTTEVLHHFTWEDVQHFVRFAQEKADVAVGITGDGQAFADQHSFKKFQSIGLFKKFPPCQDVQELARSKIVVSGINLLCLQEENLAPIKEMLQQLFPQFVYLEAGYGWLAILPPNVNKATGVQLLMQEMRITPENTISFGDSENDLPLLRLVPHSFAMKNASVYVQSCAAEVTDKDNNENGAMLKALEYFG